MLHSAMMLSVAIAFVIPAATSAQDRKAELQELVFGLCPRILAGTVSLMDEAQVKAVGFSSTAPRGTPGGKLPRAEKGSGADKVVLSSGPETCSVWFGGPENPQLAGGMVERALAAKMSGSQMPQRLGDGTMVFVFRDKSAKRLVSIFLGDAGGELGLQPATTVVMMNDKDK